MTAGVEEWRPVVGYEGLYEVSDQGNVRSLGRLDSRGRRRAGRLMAGTPDGEGYLKVGLTPKSPGGGALASRQERIHVLVLSAFAGPRPAGMEACHEDDNPANNVLANLRWDVPRENKLDARRNRTRLTMVGRWRRHAGLTRPRRAGVCTRGHQMIEPNLTPPLAAGRRRCLACQRGHNSVKDAAKRGETLDLRTEANRHYIQVMTTSSEQSFHSESPTAS